MEFKQKINVLRPKFRVKEILSEIEKCLNLGWSVIIFAIHKPKRIRKLNRVKYLVGNLYNKETLKQIDLNFDYVINLGGYVDHIHKKETFNTHYIGEHYEPHTYVRHTYTYVTNVYSSTITFMAAL